MSMFESLGRFGAAIKYAHNRNKSIRTLNSLPPEIQKDIGWPVSPRQRPAGRAVSPDAGLGALMTFADKCKLLGKRRDRRDGPGGHQHQAARRAAARRALSGARADIDLPWIAAGSHNRVDAGANLDISARGTIFGDSGEFS